MNHAPDLVAVDPSTLRNAFAQFPSGVAALIGQAGGQTHVMVASSFAVGVSLEPALAMFAVQRSSTTWPDLAKADRIGVSVLSDIHAPICRQLAGRDKDRRLSGVAHERRPGGAIVLPEASLRMDCRVYATHPAGDHDVVILEVLAVEFDDECEPLIWHRSAFRALAQAS